MAVRQMEWLFILGLIVVLALMFAWRRLKSYFPQRRTLYEELKDFFKSEPRQLPIVSRTFMAIDLPNLNIAITEYAQEQRANLRVVGYASPSWAADEVFAGIGLRQVVSATWLFESILIGLIRYRDVDIDVDKTLRCVENGIYLIETPDGKLAANLRREIRGNLELEVMCEREEVGAKFLERIRELAWKRNVYRGKCISLECTAEEYGTREFLQIRFRQLPQIRKEDIVLPEETMAIIERNIVHYFRHSSTLRKLGRPVKRGLLFYGKPGTGKTYTAKWLAQSLEGATVIMLTGENLWLIKQCCQLAQMLEPSLVIVEDADLIASERDQTRHPLYQTTLHDLLNEMDGIAPDAQVIFILTTNRPDVLEPALVARPGRIDQAIEFPLPGPEERRRLFELYGRGLVWAVEDMERLIAKTEGASPAFIAELVRKAALFALDENSLHEGKPKLTDRHFDMALREMLFGGGELTRRLFGFEVNSSLQ